MQQLDLMVPSHGGSRKGAGRPKTSSRMAHGVREVVRKGTPVLVTIRVASGLPTLREAERFRLIVRAADEASGPSGRIVHYSVQADHLHLMAESDGTAALSALMRRFQIRVARALNRLLGRRGPVFQDRYHYLVLRTPRQVRHAYAYLFNNHRHHVHDATGRVLHPDYLDPFSTAVLFDGWSSEIDFTASYADPTRTWPPQSWLLRAGWRRHAPISFDEIPAFRRRKTHSR